MCLAEFELLSDEGQFPDELCRAAIARIDQLLRGIDELAVASIDEWNDLELPPLIPVEPESEEERLARAIAVEAIADVERVFAPRLRPVIRKRIRKPPPKESPGPSGRPREATK